ncbi:hypothetical protein JXB28_05960 [Candidatus Woesearchaeota archaeon]|nr:hypothetical protein [Candidatus Woesearchaeota archaeon]
MAMNFVSVSGVSELEQLEGIGRVYHGEKIGFPLVIGYQVSSKSINQGTRNPRQPYFSELGMLNTLTEDYGLHTAVHYYTKDNAVIMADLEKIIDAGIEPSATLLQLNTLPCSLEELAKINEMGFNVIFKVAVSNKQAPQGGYAVWKGEGVQDVTSGEAAPLVSQVAERLGLIDYAMFDPSHGTNLSLDFDENSMAMKFGKAIVNNPQLMKIGLVYAGGIKPGNVSRITRLLHASFPNRFSIDTESGVRANDELDLGLVKEYLLGYKKALE